jgi:glycosyltransferase involved in cell wall biosynthesis
MLTFERDHRATTRVVAMARQLHGYRPDLVQSAHFYTNLYAVAVARLLRVAEVGAIRSDTVWAVGEVGRGGRASLRVPRHLAVNSRVALTQAADLGVPARRLSYLPNVVDIDAFTPSRSPDPRVNLLAVGRLEAVKRHDRFLDVVRRAIDALPHLDIRATVVGEGPRRSDLAQQAISLGISDKVTFLADAAMASVYQDASMLVLTSDHEGTPNVVLEAMAAALPVVAFTVGGVPEIIANHEIGTLIPPGDMEAMSAAVIALCSDQTARRAIGARARRYVELQRSPEALTRHLQSLYERIPIKRSRGRSTDRRRSAR